MPGRTHHEIIELSFMQYDAMRIADKLAKDLLEMYKNE